MSAEPRLPSAGPGELAWELEARQAVEPDLDAAIDGEVGDDLLRLILIRCDLVPLEGSRGRAHAPPARRSRDGKRSPGSSPGEGTGELAPGIGSSIGSTGVDSVHGKLGGQSMVRMFIRHAVEDYQRWRQAYDDFDEERRGMGVSGDAVFTGVGKDTDVTVWHDFDSLESAQGFAGSDRLHEVMAGAGVASDPEIWFAQPT